MPQNYKEKIAFKKCLADLKRGGPNADHENFDEAAGLVMKTLKRTKVPAYILELFQDHQCEHVGLDVRNNPWLPRLSAS